MECTFSTAYFSTEVDLKTEALNVKKGESSINTVTSVVNCLLQCNTDITSLLLVCMNIFTDLRNLKIWLYMTGFSYIEEKNYPKKQKHKIKTLLT